MIVETELERFAKDKEYYENLLFECREKEKALEERIYKIELIMEKMKKKEEYIAQVMELSRL